MIGVVMYLWLHNASTTGGLNLIELTAVQLFDGFISALNFQAPSSDFFFCYIVPKSRFCPHRPTLNDNICRRLISICRQDW